MTLSEVIATLKRLYPDERWPKPLHLLQAAMAVDNGTDPKLATNRYATSTNKLKSVVSSDDRVEAVLGTPLVKRPQELPNWDRTVGILGQLLLGQAAEQVFEEMFKAEMPNRELQLRDVREGRSDTDYRLVNGGGRPVYRLNIKFHGSRFRRARELIGLDPENSFALATYKILGALKKQEEEQLPYFFAVVGVSNLTGQVVGEKLPAELVNAVAFLSSAPRMQGKRDLEDRAISYVAVSNLEPYPAIVEELRNAQWFVLSARRADRLLREKLFERVYALRIRNFSRVFGGAEIDMHFSLTEDLIPIEQFFETVHEAGLHKITTMFERGDY